MGNPSAVAAGDDVLAKWGNDVADRVVPIFANDAARDAAIPSPETGRLCYADDHLWLYNGTNWQQLGPAVVAMSQAGTVVGAFGAYGAGSLSGVSFAAHLGAWVGERVFVADGSKILLRPKAGANGQTALLLDAAGMAVGHISGGAFSRDFEVEPKYHGGTDTMIHWADPPVGTSGRNVYHGMTPSNSYLYISAASSSRYKTDLAQLSGTLDSDHLLNIPVKQGKYKPDYLRAEDQRAGQYLPMLVAEDVHAHYPVAVDLNEHGDPDAPNDRFLIPPMLDLIQKQHHKITDLEARVAALEAS